MVGSLAACSLACAAPANAQEAAPPTTADAQVADQDSPSQGVAAGTQAVLQESADGEDKAIVVTGSRIRRPNLESQVPITSVSGDTFIQAGNTNIGDALNDLPQLRPYIDLPKMAELTESQVHEILGAVIEADQDRARVIAERDDEVDALYHKIWEELVSYMVNDPSTVQRAAILLFLAKDLERIADRVTNIAEDVVFLHTGRIVELS